MPPSCYHTVISAYVTNMNVGNIEWDRNNTNSIIITDIHTYIPFTRYEIVGFAVIFASCSTISKDTHRVSQQKRLLTSLNFIEHTVIPSAFPSITRLNRPCNTFSQSKLVKIGCKMQVVVRGRAN